MECVKIPARYVMAVMGLWGIFTTYMMRVSMSVAIVDMIDFDAIEPNTKNRQDEPRNSNYTTNSTHHVLVESPCLTSTAGGGENNISTIDEIKFLWTASQQGLVLGGFSYGTTFSQIGMAHVGRRFGHVRVAGFAMMGASFLTIVNPIIAKKAGYVGLFVFRILVGILAGAAPPLLVGLAGIWSPPQERSRIMAIILLGVPIGVCCIMPTAGLLAGSIGWTSVFYVTGCLGMCWAILFMLLIHEHPDIHPRISQAEKEYIKSSLQTTTPTDSTSVPWSKILKSGSVISLAAVYSCSLYGRNTISITFPTYLRTVQKADVKMSGILGAIPFAANGLLLLATGPIVDLFISKGIRTLTIRKTFTGIGLTVSAAAIVGLAYSGCNLPLAVTMGAVVVAMDAFTVPGFKSCILDIAPEMSGVIFSICGTCGMSTGIFAPQIVGLLRVLWILGLANSVLDYGCTIPYRSYAVHCVWNQQETKLGKAKKAKANCLLKPLIELGDHFE